MIYCQQINYNRILEITIANRVILTLFPEDISVEGVAVRNNIKRG